MSSFGKKFPLENATVASHRLPIALVNAKAKAKLPRGPTLAFFLLTI